MKYNKKEVLTQNINAIKLALSKKKHTQEEIQEMKLYKGFGGIKCILYPVDKPELFSKDETPLVPLIKELHQVIKDYSSTEEYEQIISSVKNSVLSAFYTPDVITKTLHNSIQAFVPVEKMLDPSAGMGAFIESSKAVENVAFEKDILTGRILQAVYPDTEVHITGFEKIDRNYENSFDLVSSNIPFGDGLSVFDPIYSREQNRDKKDSTKSIHNYFFMKGLDMTREGGILAFVTTSGTMDSQRNEFVRKAMLKEANLLAAIRLPDNLFSGTGGIEVSSDLIILQKNTQKKDLTSDEELFIKAKDFSNVDERIGTFNDYHFNKYYQLGEKSYTTNKFGEKKVKFTADSIQGIQKQLQDFIIEGLEENLNHKLFVDNRINLREEKKVVPTKGKAKEKNVGLQLSLFDTWEEMTTVVAKKTTTAVVDLQKQAEEKAEKQFSLYKDLYYAYYNLSSGERERQIALTGEREKLNTLYDAFVKEVGYINSIVDNKLIIDDSSFNEMKSIELYEDGKYIKADIFREPISIKQDLKDLSIEDALSLSLNEFNYPDFDYMSNLTGVKVEDIESKLIGNEVFYSPSDGRYVMRAEFLSGNVVQKAQDILDFMNTSKEYLIASQKEIEENIQDPWLTSVRNSLKSLQDIRPEIIPLEEIGIHIGERWIPTRFYEEFSKTILNPPTIPYEARKAMNVNYTSSLDEYFVSLPEYTNYQMRSYANEQFGVKSHNRRYDAEKVLEIALQDKTPDMTITVVRDGVQTKIPDTKGIQAMNSVVEDIKRRFVDWIDTLGDGEKKQLEKLYNDKFNNIVQPKYDGAFQTFPDLDFNNLGIKDLYLSQKDAVLMLKSNYGGIVDHEVGAGKSLVMCCAAYEMKRLGIANKPLITALKANVHDVANTYKKAYPNAKVLYPSINDLKKDEITSFLGKIQNNNWDVIILSHEQFLKIPQSPEVQHNIISEELAKLEDSILLYSGDLSTEEMRAAFKRLESAQERLENKLQEVNLMLADKKDENIVDFKTMGIDHIFVDESHQFKNLSVNTKHNRVAGLGNLKGSQRSQNMLYAIRTIQDRIGRDLGATFLSGTTISNSLTELYTLFNYLRPQALKDQGINSFDAWLATYAIKSTEFEFSVTNDIIQKERFREFCKVPELAAFYNEITDYKTAEMIGIDRPEKVVHLIEIDKTPDQIDMYERLKEFAQTADGTKIFRNPLTDSEEKAKMLIATNTAKNASIDMRLIDPNRFDEHEGNKINHCVNHLLKYYNDFNAQKGTQFVFSDVGVYDGKKEWDVYSEIKKKLVENGVPANEVQFIQNFKTDAKKAEFQKKMNSGEIRIGLGSTSMLGTGVNAQQRAVAVHHIDIPWRPSDMEQRDGRAVRQGNWVAKEFGNNQVPVLIYATRETLDVYKFTMLQNKSLFISQIKGLNIGVRTIDEGSMDEKTGMSYDEWIAALSGRTDLLDKAKIEKQIAQLKSEENTFKDRIRNREKFVGEVKNKIEKNGELITKLEKDKEKFEKIPRDKDGNIQYSITLAETSRGTGDTILLKDNSFKTYDNAKDAGSALNAIVEVLNKDTVNFTPVGKFFDFEVGIRAKSNSIFDENAFENRFYIRNEDTRILHTHNSGLMPRTAELAGEFFEKALGRIDGLLETHMKSEKDYKQELAGLLATGAGKFHKAEQLESLEKELSNLVIKINDDINKNKNQTQEKEKSNDIEL